MLERLLSVCFEADQNGIDSLKSEDCDAGGVEIQGYLPETVLTINKLDRSIYISNGDIDASMEGGPAPDDPDQNQKINTTLLGKLVLYKYFIFSVRLNIKVINVLYAADEHLGLPDLGSTSPFCSIDDLSAVYHISLYFLHLFIIAYKCSFIIHHLFTCKMQKK